MNIHWFDGKDASNHFVLEMNFASGGKSYLKNTSYEKICHYYNLFWNCPDLVSLTIYNPENKVVASKNRMSTAA